MTTLLDIALGMALVFLATALLSGAAFEVIARMRATRGRFLREGLMSLVPDRWLYLHLVNHPLVTSLYRGRPGKGDPPSYIPAQVFANALADTLLSSQRALSATGTGTAPLSHQSLRAALVVAKGRDESVGHALLPIVDAAADLESALAGIERWFDATMDRVKGWYKVHAQKWTFAIGLLTAIALDIDALRIMDALAHSSTLRSQAVATAERVVEAGQLAPDDAQSTLTALGIGRHCGETLDGVGAYARCIQMSFIQRAPFPAMLGWLITAMATSFGAAFWFDVMKRIVDPRIAGKSPEPTR